MRAIQVVNVRWYNATAWYGVTLADVLTRAGHPSLVVGLENTPPLAAAAAKGLPARALALNTLRPSALLRLWRDMDALVREFRPDVVQCHRGEAFILWALLKRRHHFALIRTRGDRRPPKNTRLNRWLHASAADAVVATNSLMARHCVDVLGVPAGRVHTILGGVDTSRFAPDAAARAAVRARLGFGPDDVAIGLLGRLDEVKGVRETIRALGAAGDPRLRLLLIGFDSQYSAADVERWTREAGLGPLGERVVLTGRAERPEDYINALDLGVVASLGSEAIARAALEIMACGVPLISSTTGVMPDLAPGDALFEPGDEAAMARLMAKAPDAAWRADLAGRCRARMADLSLDAFGEQTLALYRAVLSPTHKQTE